MDLKKHFLFFAIVATGVLSLILSGCFMPMQTTVSFDSYIQATPFSSISHIYISIKSINVNTKDANGNNVSAYSSYNREYDLVPQLNGTMNFYVANSIPNLQSSFNGTAPFFVSSLYMKIGPVATVVLGNGDQYFIPVSTSVTVPFYNYNQQMQQAPMQVNYGQNKTALILWNLSNLSTAATIAFTLNAIGLDMSQLVPLYVTHGTASDPSLYGGLYRYASVSDFSKNFTFTSQGYWNMLNNTYDFTLYPFVAPTSQGYSAIISINSATQTITHQNVTIYSSPISLNL